MQFAVDHDSEGRLGRTAGSMEVLEIGFPGGTRMALHHHPDACLSLVMSGGFTEEIGGKELVARPGSVLAKPAGVPHRDVWGRPGSRQVVLVPSSAARGDEPAPWRELVREPTLRTGGEWLGAARRISLELRLADDLTDLGVEIALDRAVNAEKRGRDTSPAHRVLLARTRDYIHAHFTRSITTGEIARAVGVSRAHLARTFRNVGGLTLTETIRRLRVEYAACRLLTTCGTLSGIAQESGFSDQSHMTREFRRFLGSTPGSHPRADGDPSTPDHTCSRPCA